MNVDPSMLKALADWGLSPVWALLIWVIHRLGQLIGSALFNIQAALVRMEEKLERHIHDDEQEKRRAEK